MDNLDQELTGIAIVGMAGRFPGAQTVEQFWQNLCAGVESITTFTEAELAQTVAPEVLQRDDYVKAGSVLEDIEDFDANFFGLNPREAALTDPQHRFFLECAWEALETAGYDPDLYPGRIGVYAGASLNSYLLNLETQGALIGSVDSFQTLIGNDKDFLTTRVAYKLNLKGPSVTIQTACSTSLVATSLACQSLLNYQCDMALAGGVSIRVPHQVGYLYQEGGILSPDGHCRAFDAKAQGTVIGNGVGIVVLKRLEDAIAEGDTIYAVIKGHAINNDGAVKVGYTAPSIEGQAEAIAEALAIAEVDPATVSYVEAHGTGTALGDPIEVAALTQAFRASTDKTGFCAIGSVKTNVGHLDAAAGVTGLIKTALALKHQLIPPSLHFEQPNPQINFADSPFYVNTQLREWGSGETPRRAGVSSMGIGGTNAHLVLEEAPMVAATPTSRPAHLLVLSAKTASALETATLNLAQHLQQHPEQNLADVAYTLQVGRKGFTHRRMLVCQDVHEAIATLASGDPQCLFSQQPREQAPSVVFLFPGQGSQHEDMGWKLYKTEPVFQEWVDRCVEILKPSLGLDLRHILYPQRTEISAAHQLEKASLQQTWLTQPALFVVEYALAQLWRSWGIQPQALMGHSIGEYVAACLAGVFSLEDALALVVIRGQLMQSLPAGAMLSVALSEEALQPFLSSTVTLAASNGPALCVVAGHENAIAALEAQLTTQGVGCRRLHTSHAFHSPMMDPIVEEFAKRVSQISLHPPQMPVVSNVTGTWMTVKQATDPHYWAMHLRQPVRFNQGLECLLQQAPMLFLEVGPGKALSTLVKQQAHPEAIAINSMRHPQDLQSDSVVLWQALGQLWLAGVTIDWAGVYAQEHRLRVPLPTYPFERQRYWIEPKTQTASLQVGSQAEVVKPDIADWFYTPVWKQAQLPTLPHQPSTDVQNWLIFIDDCGVGVQLVGRLCQAGKTVITVSKGGEFACLSETAYAIAPQQPADYEQLLQALTSQNQLPQAIAHCWSLTADQPISLAADWSIQDLGFYSLLFLAQAIGNQAQTQALQLNVITNHLYDITGYEVLAPEKSAILGCCQVIPQEYPQISCRQIDICLADVKSSSLLIPQLSTELQRLPTETNTTIAYRNRHRWVQTYEAVRLENSDTQNISLRQAGVYLITGGLGGIGLTLATYLAQTVSAKLVLVSRSGLPAPAQWSQWLKSHDDADKISQQIRQVQELERLGAEVLVVQADVSDRRQIQQAIAQAQARFGTVHGVIHAAGIPGGGLIQLKTLDAVSNVFAPKIQGTLMLAEALKEISLDFFVLCSSLSAIVGGLGQVDYVAANAFLDAFAQQQARQGGSLTVAINWDTWQAVGMAVNTVVPDAFQSQRQASLEQGLRPEEGIEAFQRILNSQLPQVIVSKQELQTAKLKTRELAANYLAKLSSTPALTSDRPLKESDYVEPRNEIEQKITDIWRSLLGIEQIGVQDNFFELGGHSLLAVQLTSRLREVFQVEVSLRTLLLDSPTIAGLAEVVAAQLPQTEDIDEMAQLLAEIESLSMEEIQAELAERSQLSRF